MMRWLIGTSLKFRRLVLAIAAGMMVFGFTQIHTSSVDTLPEFKPVTVEVQTEALGLSAAEVEQLITVPLEQDLLNGVAFLDQIESASIPGLSSVVMTFEPGTELLDARQVVQERLTQAVGAAGLPQVAKHPQMLQPLSSTSRVSMIRLSSDRLSQIEISVLARWVIAPRLLGVGGVANVAIWGQRERQLQVLVDPERLAGRGVTLQQVIATAGNALETSPLSFLEASSPGTGGFIDTLNQRLQIFHEQTIDTPEELAQVPIEDPDGRAVFVDGRPLLLGDVTEVVEDHQPLIGDARCGDAPCLLLVVEKAPDANTLQVTEGVDEALEALGPGLDGLRMDSSVYRPATYLERSLGNLGLALIVGAVLLLLVLGLFLFDWRTVLICALVIPLSLMVAFVVLDLQHATFDTMVLAGLVVALVAVIDDAVSDVRHVAQRMRGPRASGEEGAPTWAILLESVVEMRRAILFGALISLLALLPGFFLDGEAGAFLPPIALAYLLGVAASMVVALTVTPALAMFLLTKGPAEHREPPVVRWVQRRYDRVSSGLVARRAPALVTFAVVMAAGLAAIPFLDRSLRPSLRETDLLVKVEAPPGTSLPAMNELVARTMDELGRIPGVRNVGGHVGRAVVSDQVVNVSSGEIWVGVDASADHDATVAEIEGVIAGQDGLSADLVTYSDDRSAEVLREPDEDLVVRVYGQDTEVLRTLAQEVRGLMDGIDGVVEPTFRLPAQEPTVEIEVDLGRAQVLGVKPGDVRRSAAVLLSGITVGNLFDEQKVFDVVVWGVPEIRRTEQDVADLLIDTPGGGQVRLGQVADVRVVPNPAVIRHSAASRFVDITAAVGGRSVGAVAGDVERALRQVAFPLEYHAEVLGGHEERRAAILGVIAVAAAAALGIFLLLQAAFGSWRLAAVAFLALPMALAGGSVAVALDGRTITLGSLAGFAAVLGLAARGVVGLIGEYQRVQVLEGRPLEVDAIARVTRERIASIVTVALGVAAVLLPFLFFANAPGMEIVRPMAVVVVGGVVSSALLVLAVLPAAFLRFGAGTEADAASEDLVVAIPDVDVVPGTGR